MLTDLEHNLERIANGVAAQWGIYVKFLADGAEVCIKADTPMDTMSVIKIPVLVELFRQVDAGRRAALCRCASQYRQWGKRHGAKLRRIRCSTELDAD